MTCFGECSTALEKSGWPEGLDCDVSGLFIGSELLFTRGRFSTPLCFVCHLFLSEVSVKPLVTLVGLCISLYRLSVLVQTPESPFYLYLSCLEFAVVP